MILYFLILLFSRIIAAQKINLRLSFDDSFESFSDMGCRTKYGDKGVRGIDFDLYFSETFHTCKSICLFRGDSCFGFEYGTLGRGRCKIWKLPIDEYRLEHVYGLNCYIKDPPPPTPAHKPPRDMCLNKRECCKARLYGPPRGTRFRNARMFCKHLKCNINTCPKG